MRKLIVTLTAVFVFILTATAQDRTISGTVTNDNKKPVEGVTVVTPNGKQGTQTDKDGKYSLTISAAVRSLIFSSRRQENFHSGSFSRFFYCARVH